MKKIERSYKEVRSEIRDADLLLFRPRGLIWRLVAVAGRSEYTHAAMAGWWTGRLMNVEMTNGGGRAQLLSNIVQRWPGIIDVYQANAAGGDFSRQKALERMIEITGLDYGWGNLFKAAMLHLPWIRLAVTPATDDCEESRNPPFCSEAVAIATKAGGVDPVPNLADFITEPADLSRSKFYKYKFTLV